jgi:hypothetical protein
MILGAWVLAGCSNGSSGTTPGNGSGPNEAGSSTSDDSGGGSGDAQQPTDDSGQTTNGEGGATQNEGGSVPVDGGGLDGGVPRVDGGDGGLVNVGSCCTAHTTPGCDNADLELCVCNMTGASSCCTTAWTLACALLVQQKYCQAGVRQCVCGTDVDAGQWAQTSCCSTDWTSTCDSVASVKCHAVTGCF